MGLFDYLEEKRLEAVRKRRVKEAGKIATGIALGAIGGILFAPQEGKKTREEIVEKSKEAADQAREAALDARDSVEFKAYLAGEQAKKTYNDLKEAAINKKAEFDEDVEVAKAKAEAIGDVIKSGAEDIKEDVDEAAEGVKETAKDAKEDLKDSAKDAKKDIDKSSKNIKETVKDTSKKVEKEAKKN
ncbi:YtxH domain-containing protein [Peptoniphilus sp.]|uniref:YtxH domain-containing protein n=1 Tax=Peptoniphilus sp. TaxID=1971214 RepID=UPI003D8A6F52